MRHRCGTDPGHRIDFHEGKSQGQVLEVNFRSVLIAVVLASLLEKARSFSDLSHTSPARPYEPGKHHRRPKTGVTPPGNNARFVAGTDRKDPKVRVTVHVFEGGKITTLHDSDAARDYV